MLTDLASDGSATGATRCSHYVDTNPAGYYDPIQLMVARYHLQHSNATHATYQYRLGQQTATMTTGPLGAPPQHVALAVADTGAAYDFGYFHRVAHVDHGIFYSYHGLDCTEVSNFTAPDVCFDSWLGLQYECD